MSPLSWCKGVLLKVRFLLFPLSKIKRINRRMLWIGNKFSSVFHNIRYQLKDADIEVSSEEYLTASFFSAFIYALVGFGLVSALGIARGATFEEQLPLASLAGICFGLVFFALHLVYPKILSKQKVLRINDSLIFALNNLIIQISSGVSMYEAMSTLSKSDYGQVSKEFGKIVEDINSGVSEAKALEKSALQAKSEYFKKTIWQIITSIKSGASLYGALNSVLDSLIRKQVRGIRDYAAELNLWILIYLLGAAAIPSLGITFLVMISALGGAAVNEITLIVVAASAVVFQILLIGFVRTRVPKVLMQ